MNCMRFALVPLCAIALSGCGTIPFVAPQDPIPPCIARAATPHVESSTEIAVTACSSPISQELVSPPSGPESLKGPEIEVNKPGPDVWGVVGLRGYVYGDQVAPNGLEFHPLFSLDLDFNLWISREARVYAFMDSRFWGQKAAPGVTNASQGVFDFSKRELDLNLGVAWNYYGSLEARAFVYSANNLNRGDSTAHPSGYNDGMGLENRWYIEGTYHDLGKPDFDVTRASFLSCGYYPTKDMVDAAGTIFKPGPFARAYMIWELEGEKLYLFADAQFLATRSFTPKQLYLDAGIAARPFLSAPHLEFRVGSENRSDLELSELETSLYLAVRYIF